MRTRTKKAKKAFETAPQKPVEAAAKKERPWEPIYMKFPKAAYEELLKMEKETGKTRTKIFEDYVLGNGQYPPDVENWIKHEASSRGLSFHAAAQALFSEAKVLMAHFANRKPSSS